MRCRVILAAAAGTAWLLGACGPSATTPVDAGNVPGRPTTTLAASAGGETIDVSLYFVRGEKLEAVARPVPKVARIGAEAVQALLAGPTDAERRNGLATAIPAGTQFRALTIDGGVARVDLSRTFESGGGGVGLTLRLAQVTCTLDAFSSVTGVRFALDGQLVDVLSGDGVVVGKPVTCDGYQAFLSQGTVVFPGIWPFATAAELEASTDPTFHDPVATAKAFAERYVGMTDATTFPFRSTGAGGGEVPVGFRTGEGGRVIPNPQPTTFVQVRQGATGSWTVTGATSPDIEVDTPAALATVTSPVALAGRARAFEGTVNVDVREDGQAAGQSLGKGFVTGRGDGVLGPFTGTVTIRPPTRRAGAVLFYERSAATGGTPILRATVVRVALAT